MTESSQKKKKKVRHYHLFSQKTHMYAINPQQIKSASSQIAKKKTQKGNKLSKYVVYMYFDLMRYQT